jgi:uncharacterized protein YqgV (UPF0045/DUF77 family)
MGRTERRLNRSRGAIVRVQAEISLFPLRTRNLAKPVKRFIGCLDRKKPEINIGAMSTQLRGDCGTLFKSIGKAFADVSRKGDLVLAMKVSNACPKSGKYA